jgi:hypothetical protein
LPLTSFRSMRMAWLEKSADTHSRPHAHVDTRGQVKQERQVRQVRQVGGAHVKPRRTRRSPCEQRMRGAHVSPPASTQVRRAQEKRAQERRAQESKKGARKATRAGRKKANTGTRRYASKKGARKPTRGLCLMGRAPSKSSKQSRPCGRAKQLPLGSVTDYTHWAMCQWTDWAMYSNICNAR